MFGFSKATAPSQIQQTFKELVGKEANNAFWRRWYGSLGVGELSKDATSLITRDDIRYIRSTGMNIIRVLDIKLVPDE
jgi:hypothetical protein